MKTRELVTLILCAIGFIGSIVYGGGIYTGFNLLILCACDVSAFVFFSVFLYLILRKV